MLSIDTEGLSVDKTRVAGVGQQPFTAGVGQAGKSEVQGAGGTVGDGNSAGGYGNAIALDRKSVV